MSSKITTLTLAKMCYYRLHLLRSAITQTPPLCKNIVLDSAVGVSVHIQEVSLLGCIERQESKQMMSLTANTVNWGAVYRILVT